MPSLIEPAPAEDDTAGPTSEPYRAASIHADEAIASGNRSSASPPASAPRAGTRFTIVWLRLKRSWQTRSARVCARWPRETVALRGLFSLGSSFWIKINNDWIFNLAGLLAYNLLVALFPILLLLLAGVGVFLGQISPLAQQALARTLASALPGDTGAEIVNGIMANLQNSVSLLLLVGLVGAYFGGSHLFITLEDCFGIIFRLRGRSFIRQNLMALGLLLFYLILVCIVFLGSVVPSLLQRLLGIAGHKPAPAWHVVVERPILSIILTAFAVGMMYAFVPNRPFRRSSWRATWPGALVTAVLLLVYEAFFPWYQEHFVHTDNYGSIGAFAIVILLFFYYFAVILLLGAEINSWVAGCRETPFNLPGMLRALASPGATQVVADTPVADTPVAGTPVADTPEDDL